MWPLDLGAPYAFLNWVLVKLGGVNLDDVFIVLLRLLDSYNERSRLFLKSSLLFMAAELSAVCIHCMHLDHSFAAICPPRLRYQHRDRA
jgi:hypothetical protein